MKNSIIILICISLFSINLKAQLKVVQDGTVKIKGDITTDDANDEVSAIVYGKYGPNLANGRLAIGDYGRMAYHGGNIFVGEYGTDVDSDIMQLHGKLGIYFTRNYGETVAYYKYSEGNKFNFNCDVYANGVKLTSDKRFKSNIDELDKMLPMLKQLNGVSYNLAANRENEKFSGAEGGTLTEKEQNSMMEYEKAKEREAARLAGKKRLGFIAQDVQKIFPELVEQDSAGYLSLDYMGLIPVLVEAVKEQQEIIDQLQVRIETLESDCCDNASLKSAKMEDKDSPALINDGAKLYQNAPNPFSVQTTIRFEIPQSVQNAQLHICNMAGSLLKTIHVNQRGEGNVTISASEFTSGMYLYSLVTDRRIVDTKQMLLTE